MPAIGAGLAALFGAIAGLFQVIHDGFTLAWAMRKTPLEQRKAVMVSIHLAMDKAEEGDSSALEAIIRAG